MTVLIKSPPRMAGRVVRVNRVEPAVYHRHVLVRFEDINDRIEDAKLNAIADERAGGPFVRVSLDDL